MSLSLVQSRALLGLDAASVTVEVHLANGLPSFTLVGLADVEVKEARERVRSAIQNAGLEFPNNKRITVNLAPADLPKDSGASTCRSRSASWRPAGRSTRRAWPATSSRASCRSRGGCGRCAARSPWRW
ncbi:MAG: Mg chelatase-related protein, partial [Variovorax sp.]|nr:Mg chelatase-related protein [Variovorax sp.]